MLGGAVSTPWYPASGEGEEIGRFLLGLGLVPGRVDEIQSLTLLGRLAQQCVELIVQSLVARPLAGGAGIRGSSHGVVLRAQLRRVRLAGGPAKARIRASNWVSVTGPLFSTSMRRTAPRLRSCSRI